MKLLEPSVSTLKALGDVSSVKSQVLARGLRAVTVVADVFGV